MQRIPRSSLLAFAAAWSILAAVPTPAQVTCPPFTAVPLPDLAGGTYGPPGGELPGGLYPGGNAVPPAHLVGALAEAASIVPLDATGRPSPTGRIGFVGVGMSNATQEFGYFERVADDDPGRDAHLFVLDGGLGGFSAEVMADPASDFWTLLQSRIASAGLAPGQVQVVALKNIHRHPLPVFPDHALALQADLAKIVVRLRTELPNLRLCYLSSRTYGCDVTDPEAYELGEPWAYESAFAIRGLIEDQIQGDPALNWDPAAAAPVVAPLLLWGPYLWADGTSPSAWNGLFWEPDDFELDGIHPSDAGEAKIAATWLDFLHTDPTASWYRVTPGSAPLLRTVVVEAFEDAFVSLVEPGETFGSLSELELGEDFVTFLKFDVSGLPRPVGPVKLTLRGTVNTNVAPVFFLVDDTTWSEATLSASNMPPLGPQLGPLVPYMSPDGSVGVGLPPAILDDSDGLVSIGTYDWTPRESARVRSREGDQPARLVLTVLEPPLPGLADPHRSGSIPAPPVPTQRP